MAMNRVQFRPGLSMAELLDRYGNDDKRDGSDVLALAQGISMPAM